MADDENSNDAPEEEKISPWQEMMDNPFLLLFIPRTKYVWIVFIKSRINVKEGSVP